MAYVVMNVGIVHCYTESINANQKGIDLITVLSADSADTSVIAKCSVGVGEE